MYAEILKRYRNIILQDGSIQFTLDEMNTLADENQLYMFMILYGKNTRFKCSANIEECVSRIKEGDTLYRVLEYCILRNKILDSIRASVGM